MQDLDELYFQVEQTFHNVTSWQNFNLVLATVLLLMTIFVVATIFLWQTNVGRIFRWGLFLSLNTIPLALLEVVFIGTPVLLGWLLKLIGATDSSGGPVKGWIILILFILFAWYVLYMIFSKAVINWIFRPISSVAPLAESASKIFVREFWFVRAVVLVGLSWFLVQDSRSEASSFAALIAIVVIAIATSMIISVVNEGLGELSFTSTRCRKNRNQTDEALDQSDSMGLDTPAKQSPP